MYIDSFDPDPADKSIETYMKIQGAKYSDLKNEQKVYYDAVYEYMYGTKPPTNASGNVAAYRPAGSGGHPEFGKIKFGRVSNNCCTGGHGGDVNGAIGATFTANNGQDVYVAYRGTGDGRWYDNGDALGSEKSPYQDDALDFFDGEMRRMGVTEETNVYVTGHSKGGNQAQYVTLASEYAGLIDLCISLDGEGFSPEAIAMIRKTRGDEFYREQIEKMYSISGNDDFVNVLGIKVIPDDHTVYVETPTGTAFANKHAMVDEEDGRSNLFDYQNGGFRTTTTEQGTVAELATIVSKAAMVLPQGIRHDVCTSIMSICEAAMGGESIGLNAENASLEDYLHTLEVLPLITGYTMFSWDGYRFKQRKTEEWIKEHVFGVSEGEESSMIVDILANMMFVYIANPVITTLELIAQGLVTVIGALATVADIVVHVAEFIGNMIEGIGNFLKEHFDSEYRAAQQYLADHSYLEFHTQDLRSLAERLQSVNSRLSSLDDQIDSLYWSVRWTDLWNLMSSDLKIGWSNRINSCANALYNIADRFEGVEQTILGMTAQS